MIVRSQANATFKSGDNIILEPGFIAEQGSNFTALIEPCDVNSARFIEDTVEIIDDKTIKIGNITIYDDSRETLPCTDDPLIIYGLDRDTTSFINYWWDYGNGVTSTNAVATIYYDEPGEYLVKLALTDSSGAIDTLTKTYIKDNCDNSRKQKLENSILANDVIIYPNPNAGSFAIELENTSKNSLIVISDLVGKVIFSKTIIDNTLQIDISNQPKGIYLVKVINGNNVTTQKIVYQ